MAIIMPTLCTPYIYADLGFNSDKNYIIINNEKVQISTWNYIFTWPWNMLSQYPVINIPIDITEENIPIGMQIIANTYEDIVAFQIASAYQKIGHQFYSNNNFTIKL